MADRVLVVCEGRITADIEREDATPEAVMYAATHAGTHDAAAHPLETAR
jgi:rhamnose transport system ATP-binding protein